ncbi:MAG: deaminase [Nanoarchaeota archaeon]|nr:deaminase [Nanoarchaeota archaeon]
MDGHPERSRRVVGRVEGSMYMIDLQLMNRAAKIAGNTKCWIGIGCVIAKDGKVLSEAWNETLDGEEYCQKFRDRDRNSIGESKGCIRYELGLSQGREIEKCCSIHAEINAIAKAARKGIKIDGSVMFITSFPCLICMRAIIASGIKKIIYMNDFYKPHHLEMLKKNGVKVEQIEF